MLENLLNLVKEHASEAIVNNPAIPNEHNDAAISTTAEGIMDHLKGLVTNGGMETIMGLFSGGSNAINGEVTNMSGNIATNLMSKFGIGSEQAGGIVNMLLPQVINSLISKTNDPNDNSFDVQSIIGSLMGGGEGLGGLLGGLKKLF
ncbi:MAG: hypothetical protein K9I82_17360 [Chitinophagaceae bacterium]|nr:hypothetical protein [Chitinophagaceae bacterium]